jgi:hypothetical protein
MNMYKGMVSIYVVNIDTGLYIKSKKRLLYIDIYALIRTYIQMHVFIKVWFVPW